MRLLSRFAAGLLTLWLAAAPAPAAEQKRAAVLEFELADGLKGVDRVYYSDHTRAAVHDAAPGLFVMTRESTDALLQANGKTMADCTGECEVEVGRKLGADYIISGRLARIGSRTVLTVRLFSTSDGQLLSSAEARGKSADELLDAFDGALAKLLAPLGGTAASGEPAATFPSAPAPAAPAAASPAGTPHPAQAAARPSRAVPAAALAFDKATRWLEANLVVVEGHGDAFADCIYTNTGRVDTLQLRLEGVEPSMRIAQTNGGSWRVFFTARQGACTAAFNKSFSTGEMYAGRCNLETWGLSFAEQEMAKRGMRAFKDAVKACQQLHPLPKEDY